jgi:hypothetical protein
LTDTKPIEKNILVLTRMIQEQAKLVALKNATWQKSEQTKQMIMFQAKQ